MFTTAPASGSVRHDAASLATLRVDVVADFICPWSYLGKRRLDNALCAVHGPVEVRWLPFRLNPGMPPEGMRLDEYLSARFESADSVTTGLEFLTRLGEAENIDFRFERIERIPDTSGAHRLMYLAESRGLNGSAVAESLYSHFFGQGADISSPEVLSSIGNEHGLVAADVHSALEDDAIGRIIVDQEAGIRKSGVAGVPAYLINQRVFISGARDTDVLVGVFDRAMFGSGQGDEVPTVLH